MIKDLDQIKSKINNFKFKAYIGNKHYGNVKDFIDEELKSYKEDFEDYLNNIISNSSLDEKGLHYYIGDEYYNIPTEKVKRYMDLVGIKPPKILNNLNKNNDMYL